MNSASEVNPQMAVAPSAACVAAPDDAPCEEKPFESAVGMTPLTRVGLVISDCSVSDMTVRAISNPCTGCCLTCLLVLDSADDPCPQSQADQWLRLRVNEPQGVAVLFDRDGGFQTMLQDPSIDAVYIITPTSVQHACVMKALEASKHVLLFDAVSTPLVEFREELDCAIARRRFLQSSTMFVHHYRVQTFLHSVRTEEFGSIETINVVLSINKEDCPLVAINFPLGPGDGCIRRLGRFCVLMSLLLLTQTAGSRPVSAFVSKYEGPADIPTSAECTVTFTDQRRLHFKVAYSTTTAPTRQVLEVHAPDRYATMTDFVVPHPDGLATYRIYDHKREERLRHATLDVVRGECMDVVSGPPQDVMMWRRFSRLARLVEEQGYFESPAAISSIALSNISIQIKQVLLALEESVLTGKEVPIVVQDFETVRTNCHERM